MGWRPTVICPTHSPRVGWGSLVPSSLPRRFAMSLVSFRPVDRRVARLVVSALTRAPGAGEALAPAAPPPPAAEPPGRAVDPEALPLPRPQGVEQLLEP